VDYVAIAVLLGFAASFVWFAWRAARRSDSGADDSSEGGAGGGGPDRGPTPRCHPPDADPEWWPEFERQFAAYVHSRVANRFKT
jgi:hypothetical protein